MISATAIETAAMALLAVTPDVWELQTGHVKDRYRWDAQVALEAAAPFIQAGALYEAADKFAPTVARSVLIESPEAIYDATVIRGRDWLRARAADLLEGK